MPLSPDQQRRLVHLLGMLGSEHDGEALNAARLAQRLLSELKLTWKDLFIQEGYSADQMQKVASEAYSAGLQDGAQHAAKAPAPSFAAYASLLLEQHQDILSDWEFSFLDSWKTKSYPPTEKQLAVFRRLEQKTGQPLPANFRDIE